MCDPRLHQSEHKRYDDSDLDSSTSPASDALLLVTSILWSSAFFIVAAVMAFVVPYFAAP